MELLLGCGIPAKEIVLSFEFVVRCALTHLATASFRIQAIAHCSHSQRKLFPILAEIFYV